jgi:hypothetical protein
MDPNTSTWEIILDLTIFFTALWVNQHYLEDREELIATEQMLGEDLEASDWDKWMIGDVHTRRILCHHMPTLLLLALVLLNDGAYSYVFSILLACNVALEIYVPERYRERVIPCSCA